jgi:hypothetical protein
VRQLSAAVDVVFWQQMVASFRWQVGPSPASMEGGLGFVTVRGAGVQQQVCSFAAAASSLSSSGGDHPCLTCRFRWEVGFVMPVCHGAWTWHCEVCCLVRPKGCSFHQVGSQ